jgi:cytochrome c oxidase subunit 2
MRMLGLTSIVLAAGLALGAPGHAQEPAAAPAANATAPEATAAPAPAAAATPAPVAAATPAVADPTLDASGKPLLGPSTTIGQPQDALYGLQEQVTPNGREAHWFHNVILVPLITAISVLVLVLLLWVIVRYRAANPVAVADQPQHGDRDHLDAAPVLILVAIAVPSIKLLAAHIQARAQGRCRDAQGDRQPVVLDLSISR